MTSHRTQRNFSLLHHCIRMATI